MSEVRRRYSEFCWLRQKLCVHHPNKVVPPLPPKHFFNITNFNQKTINQRRYGLGKFLQRYVLTFLQKISCKKFSNLLLIIFTGFFDPVSFCLIQLFISFSKVIYPQKKLMPRFLKKGKKIIGVELIALEITTIIIFNFLQQFLLIQP